MLVQLFNILHLSHVEGYFHDVSALVSYSDCGTVC